MKDQICVLMLDFCISFFEFELAACSKKNEHHNKHLVLLILAGIVLGLGLINTIPCYVNCINFLYISMALGYLSLLNICKSELRSNFRHSFP